MIIIGVDPGLATTGFGVIDTKPEAIGRETSRNLKKRKSIQCLGYGLIKTDKSLTTGERLKIIHDNLNKLIKEYRPEVMAVESIYFFKNLKTAMPVSQSKGVILLAAARKKIPVFEFTPLQVKMSVTGYGRAEKKQIQKLLKILLNLKEIPSPDDAADALGLALCCAMKLKKT
jgi:crossover junction endodeoxyribonuclease RuvC